MANIIVIQLKGHHQENTENYLLQLGHYRGIHGIGNII